MTSGAWSEGTGLPFRASRSTSAQTMRAASDFVTSRGAIRIPQVLWKPLGLRDVRSAVARHGIPDVRVRGGDVVVAAERHELTGVTSFDEPPCQPVEPRELGPIEGRVERSPVRGIEAHDPDAAADRGDHPRLGERLVVRNVPRRGSPERL